MRGCEECCVFKVSRDDNFKFSIQIAQNEFWPGQFFFAHEVFSWAFVLFLMFSDSLKLASIYFVSLSVKLHLILINEILSKTMYINDDLYFRLFLKLAQRLILFTIWSMMFWNHQRILIMVMRMRKESRIRTNWHWQLFRIFIDHPPTQTHTTSSKAKYLLNINV